MQFTKPPNSPYRLEKKWRAWGDWRGNETKCPAILLPSLYRKHISLRRLAGGLLSMWAGKQPPGPLCEAQVDTIWSMLEETPTQFGVKPTKTTQIHVVLPSIIKQGWFADLIKTGESRLLLFFKFLLVWGFCSKFPYAYVWNFATQFAKNKRKNEGRKGRSAGGKEGRKEEGQIGHKIKVKVLVTQSCPTLCNLTDCSPPGSFVHGILQARILEWVTILFSRESPDSGIKPRSPSLQVDSLPGKPRSQDSTTATIK